MQHFDLTPKLTPIILHCDILHDATICAIVSKYLSTFFVEILSKLPKLFYFRCEKDNK